MIEFAQGEQVPAWVLRASMSEYQKYATFGVPVVVLRGNGDVSVYPVAELTKDEYLVCVTKNHPECQWVGAPTAWWLEPLPVERFEREQR